jgi:hypothetical protein
LLDPRDRTRRNLQLLAGLAAVLRRVYGRRNLQLRELGEQAVDGGDVLAAQAATAGDQLRQLRGAALGVPVGGGIAGVPQTADGGQHSEVPGTKRERAAHLPVDVMAIVSAVAVRVG